MLNKINPRQNREQRNWCTIFDAFFYHALGNGGLSLAQRESMEVLAHARGLSQLQQGPCGVYPRRQNKNQRSLAGRFLHNLGREQREKIPQKRPNKVRQCKRVIFPARLQPERIK